MRRTNALRLIGALGLAGALVAIPESGVVAKPAKTGDTDRPGWQLVHQELFTDGIDMDSTPWVRDDYYDPYDTIMDDNGEWYRNDYGDAWVEARNSFTTYTKEKRIGDGGWLTASMSARDWNNDGEIEAPPTLTAEQLPSGEQVATMDVPDHTGGVIFRSTEALPSEYRIEYKLKAIDFGGKRDGSIFYDDRENGYSLEGCKTQHPWGEGSKSPGWEGDASAPYCEWQDVRSGKYGYNGWHYGAIVDVKDPKPRNNHFWHYRRKVLMDLFAQHPDRVGTGTGGRVCDSSTGEYYNYRDSSFNTVNMWVSTMPNWKPGQGGLAGNGQWFMSECSGGVAEPQLSSAAEIQPEIMPDEYYTFAIERDSTGYTLEASGNFARAGQQTLRYHRPFVENGTPIWHYNQTPEEYDGSFNGDLAQLRDLNGQTTWTNQWPKGSAYPDYFVVGDLYTNVYEGSASLTDIRMYVPSDADSAKAAATTSARTDVVDGKVQVTVEVVNIDSEPISVTVQTPWGKQDFADIPANKAIHAVFETGKDSIPSGQATIKATKAGGQVAPYKAPYAASTTT